MKKVFFMIAILAALSTAALGADSDGTVDLKITGTAIEKLTITATNSEINFGKVITGSFKEESSDLTVKGTVGEAVTITADLSQLNGLVTLTTDSDITTVGKKLTINATEAQNKATIKLKYAPTKAEDSLTDAVLKVTVAYDDTAITQ